MDIGGGSQANLSLQHAVASANLAKRQQEMTGQMALQLIQSAAPAPQSVASPPPVNVSPIQPVSPTNGTESIGGTIDVRV